MTSFRDVRQHHKKRGSIDVTFDTDLDIRDVDQMTQELVEETDHDTIDSPLRERIKTILDLTRLASNLDLYFVSTTVNTLGIRSDTLAALQHQLSTSRNRQWLALDPHHYNDAALDASRWAVSLVSASIESSKGLILLRDPRDDTIPVVAHLCSALQQCIDDHYVLNKQVLSQQLAVEIGRQAQNETLLDISAPGKSSRNLQQMGNVDLDVNIFANAAQYLCRIIPSIQGCAIFDLSEFRMTMTSSQSRSHGSSLPGESTDSSNNGGKGKSSDKSTDDSTPMPTESIRTSFPLFGTKRTSSKGSGASVMAEQSVASEGGNTHCSYLPSSTPVRILGFSGIQQDHFENLSGTISKPIIAQFLSMSRSSGLNSKTFIERVTSTSVMKLSSIAPPNSKTYLCSSVAEADTQPAYLIFAFSDQEEVHFRQTEELFLEQLGAYLIYSSIRSRVVAVDRAQVRFTQRIQHELRTPLHAIIGVNEIAKQSLSHSFNLDEMSDLVESIGTSADTLSLLIDDMVDFSLMERLSGERKLMQTEKIYSDWASICGVVASTCLHAYQLSQRISRSDQRMKLHPITPPEMFVYVPDLYHFDWKEFKAQVDLEIVRRIVWKLIMNAIQATSKGIILVTVSRKLPNEAIEAGSSTERLEITIADTGKGMEERFVNERLFQPFGKEDEESQGVGLSLSICQALTSQLSGRLTAKSKLNQGTEMLISLPLKKTSRRDSHTRSIVENGALVAFIGFDTDDKRLFKERFLLQFHLRESNELHLALIVLIAFDDPDMSSDISKEVAILQGRESKAEVVLMPTLILRELDEARLSRMEALELALGQETRTMHRPMTITEIQDFAELIVSVQEMTKEGVVSTNGSVLSRTPQDLQAMALDARLRSSSPATKYMEIPRRSSATSDTPSMDHPYCILVVEDNPLNARIMTTMLKKAGFDYMLATDGRQGVEAFRKHLPHLVLLDINMPVMDGFEACKAMRTTKSPYTHRIIAITALSTEVERRKGKECGMDDWLTKPTRMAPLLRNIHKWKKQYEGLDSSNPSTPSSGGIATTVAA